MVEVSINLISSGTLETVVQARYADILYFRLSRFICSLCQSRCQSPRSSVGGIVGLWENAEENQPLIGCLITSLTHSLLIERRAILTIQEAKYKLVHLTRLFTQYRTMHSQAQYKLHNRKIYAQKNYTMQITCKHSTICS